MILTLFLLLILLEAMYEGLYDGGSKLWSGVFEFIYKVIVLGIVFLWVTDIRLPELCGIKYTSLIKLIGAYLLLRFSIFDAIYNLIRGLPLFYIGTSKIYDKVWLWFFSWSGFPKEHFFAVVKGICFVISITWLT